MSLALALHLTLAQAAAPAAPAAPPTAAAATAPDFGSTFDPAATATHLDGHLDYLVVGGGPRSPALADAAAALEEALRRGGRAGLVMNGASLGDVSALDDPALVKRCAALPVARVAVVRAFEAAGEPPRAVVVIYRKDGAVERAFTGVAGVPLASRASVAGAAAVAAAGEGVPAAVARSVLQGAPTSSAQRTYEDEHVEFDEAAYVSSSGMVRRWSEPVQGTARRPLTAEEFYTLVERPDLAAAYGSNVAARWGVGIAGGVVALTIPLVALTHVHKTDCGPEPPLSADPGWYDASNAWMDCNQKNDEAQMKAYAIAGLGFVGAAALTSVIVWSMPLHPVTPGEARKLGEDYNRRLRSKLGLAAAPRPAGPTLTVSAGPLPGGGRIGLALRF